MSNNDIITFIKNNLNHDFEHDFNYLLKELIHYQSLVGGKEIVKSILEIIKTDLGEEGLKRLREIETKAYNERINKFNEGIKLIKEQKPQEAQEIFVHLIDTFGIKFDDDVPVFNFQNIIESIINSKLRDTDIKTFRQIREPIAGYYFHSALIFFQEKDFEESSKLLDKVLEYNPVYVEGLLLKSECCLKEGYSNRFLELVTEALTYAYTRSQLAKCYFLLGKYYLELGFKDLGIALLLTSKGSEATPFTDQLLKNAINGGPMPFNSTEEIKEYLVNNNIQFGPNPKVIMIINKIIEEARSKNDVKLLRFLLRIQVGLTKDKKLEKELESLKEN